MDLRKLKVETFQVKDKFVMISEADLTEEQMGAIAQKFKKAGAVEVVFTYGGVELKPLSDEDLENIGLFRIPKDLPTPPRAKKKKVSKEKTH
jgi:hypothetical protein